MSDTTIEQIPGSEPTAGAVAASDEQLVAMLVDRARSSEGLQLTGEGGLLQQLTKRVLESGLEGEITELLQRCSSSVRTALAIDVRRLGLHRDLRKIRQDFRRATPRSTGARVAARARLRVSVGVSSCRGLRLMPVVSHGPAPW